jgi:pimeloyl-ACP methyl ester carboxylesterase
MQSDGGWDLSQFTLVSWCPPGYGHSRPPDRRVNADMNKHDANCALALMQVPFHINSFCFEFYVFQHLGLLPFSVVGWSEGGRTCTHLAYTAPKHVRKIVIFSSVLVDTDELYRIFQSEFNAFSFQVVAIFKSLEFLINKNSPEIF